MKESLLLLSFSLVFPHILIHTHNIMHTYVHTITVPAFSCDAPVSSNGVITVTWSYIHTGGLPLTNVFLTYTNSILGNSTGNFSNRSPLNTVSVSSVDSTSIVVPNLVTGAEYVFNVTAENSYGSSSIVCGPIPHLIGKIEYQEVGSKLMISFPVFVNIM